MIILLACKGSPTAQTPDIVGDSDSAVVQSSETLVISEVLADSSSGSDWIEVFNPGPDTVDLAGWTLSDDPGEPGRWMFPSRTLVPGEFLVVFASGEDLDGEELHTSFSLSRDGEHLVLVEPSGALSSELEYPALPEDVSFGRSQVVEQRIALGDGDTAEFSLSEDGATTEVLLGVGFDGDYGSGELTNLALFASTTQSTDGYGRTGAQAVDGELSTFSHTNLGDLDPWWQVDLDDEAWIDEIVLYSRLDCCAERLYNLTVEVLDDDEVPVFTSEVLNPFAEGETPVTPGEVLSVSVGELGRFVRVSKESVNGASSSEWLTFAEVEVLGAASAPYGELFQTDVAEQMLGLSAEGWIYVELDEVADRAVLEVQADDGFRAWLAGELVLEHNVEAEPDFATVEAVVDPGLLDGFLLQGLNTAADDDDFLLRPTLTSSDIETGGLGFFTVPTPGEPNGVGLAGSVGEVEVSVARGFLEAPESIAVWTPTEGATLVYTLDGSEPTAEHGVAVDGEIVLDVETTTVLRAFAYAEGRWDSPVVTHTWLFLEDVIEQPSDPEGFPATWDGISQSAVYADYEMDPEVVEAYREDLLRGLRAIPTMSVVMDPEDLFGADDGLYVHSLQRGREWEREASIELILPDGSTGFVEDAGLKVHGYGWRYHSNTKKHALRLEFREDYGDKKLEYPLFADAPVDRFDSIVLRCQGSRSWQDFRDPAQAQYIRDAFARDTAKDMGKVDGHATYVHLYLNGLYWGLYMPVERPDAGFGEEYFGGTDSEYDAINRRTTTNEAIDGTLEAYEEMLALADAGLGDDAGWEAINEVLDVVDLVDYMLIHQYTVNLDGPEIFSSNNMRGVRNRNGGLWRFFVWDMEYSLWTPEMNYNIDVDVAGSISHVYTALRDNPEFIALYDERATLHLTGAGALTPAASIARYEARAEEIEDAIIGESARWGDTDREPPYTRDVEWEQERQRLLTEFFPTRTEELIAQLQAAGLLQ
ncbi:MAG TPA: CotH kinase family protein [Myxococcota bacterium]|nr:CotH kinase family protein [Myxococcota bacterium]